MTINDATHKLRCRHCIGAAVQHYTMPCIILKKMPKRRLKILVFGDRNDRSTYYISKIRYVPAYNVSPL